jgi:hypothetical protein
MPTRDDALNPNPVDPIERGIVGKDTMSWENGRGNKVTRAINQFIDVRDFIGTPGYALLFIAANTNLSGGEIDRYLKDIAGVGRSRNWIQKRRWLFQKPGTSNPTSPVNVDGKDSRAREIMRMFPKLSVRDLAAVLKVNGVIRSREWVRIHRCE